MYFWGGRRVGGWVNKVYYGQCDSGELKKGQAQTSLKSTIYFCYYFSPCVLLVTA